MFILMIYNRYNQFVRNSNKIKTFFESFFRNKDELSRGSNAS